MAVSSYNTNPALNTSIAGVDISEGCDAAGYNDALRQIMADIATWTASGLESLGGLSSEFRDIPIITKTGAFTFSDAERACGIFYTGGTAQATIPTYATVPITVGAVFAIHNNGTGILTIDGTSIGLRQNGATGYAAALLAVGGVATLTHWGTDYWTITGAGLS